MQYRIVGANRDTGDGATFVVEAASESEAMGSASAMGFVVRSATPIWPIRPVPGPRESLRPAVHVACFLVIIIVLIVGLGFPILQTLIPQTQVTPRWEYRIVSPSDLMFEDAMKGYGEQGWELVFARRASSGDGPSASMSYEIIIKRPRR